MTHSPTSGTADRVSFLDRLIARWEVSRLAFLPLTVSMVSLWAGLVGLAIVAKITGVKPVFAGRILCVMWLVAAALEIGRNVWTMRHRYASPRWLRSVSVAVGDEIVVHALASLIERHRHEPDYVVTRSDMVHAVQAERARLRDMARRAEGFRLVEPPEPIAIADNA